VIYALLVTLCTVAFLSLLKFPTDETWGCRYMHLAIAPLVLCIGAAWPRAGWRTVAPLAVLALVGAVVSFLGAFYYYGVQDFAMKDAGQNTAEWITGDTVWNPVEFNARLFAVWFSENGNAPVLWSAKHIWVWTPPPDTPPWKSINLRDYCQPQSFMVRFWHVPKSGVVFRIFVTYLFSLILGVLMLAWVIVRTVREGRLAEYADSFTLEAKEARAV
jgi:hypothetical protein